MGTSDGQRSKDCIQIKKKKKAQDHSRGLLLLHRTSSQSRHSCPLHITPFFFFPVFLYFPLPFFFFFGPFSSHSFDSSVGIWMMKSSILLVPMRSFVSFFFFFFSFIDMRLQTWQQQMGTDLINLAAAQVSCTTGKPSKLYRLQATQFLSIYFLPLFSFFFFVVAC